MNKNEIQYSKQLVTSDKRNIWNFLKANGFRVNRNSIVYLFLEYEQYKNLWELKGEPESVKVQFTIERITQGQLKNFPGIQENLINKIVERAWPDNPGNPQDYLTATLDICQHQRQSNWARKRFWSL